MEDKKEIANKEEIANRNELTCGAGLPPMEITDVNLYFNSNIDRRDGAVVVVSVEGTGSISGIVTDPKHEYFGYEVDCSFVLRDLDELKEKMIELIKERNPAVQSVDVSHHRPLRR